jgi:hypothetical protein
VYVQVAYQPETGRDEDPAPETGRAGITFAITADDAISEATVLQGSEGALIFMETTQDVGGLFPTIAAPHEVGHQFGLGGDDDPISPNYPEFGIMSGASTAFVDRHLNVLRWRVKSPGQP